MASYKGNINNKEQNNKAKDRSEALYIYTCRRRIAFAVLYNALFINTATTPEPFFVIPLNSIDIFLLIVVIN